MEDSGPGKLPRGVKFYVESDVDIDNTQILQLNRNMRNHNLYTFIYHLIDFLVIYMFIGVASNLGRHEVGETLE